MATSYVGSALRVFRVIARMTEGELAAALSIELGRPITEHYIEEVEQSGDEVNSDMLTVFCKVLGRTPALVQKAAHFLEEQEKIPEKEVLKEVMEESEYRLWKTEQERLKPPDDSGI